MNSGFWNAFVMRRPPKLYVRISTATDELYSVESKSRLCEKCCIGDVVTIKYGNSAWSITIWYFEKTWGRGRKHGGTRSNVPNHIYSDLLVPSEKPVSPIALLRYAFFNRFYFYFYVLGLFVYNKIDIFRGGVHISNLLLCYGVPIMQVRKNEMR